ncbi:peptide deformylase [Lacticaseibacillus saniviri]|uniref:Peptide deformylase n=1 Tax=Lacticaseibacillus saniviri JCM 17471 = DSM 24301 TaxID=1293598 RepID=A0A0R2N1J0_9LACO|nr:peptide deformylase [Lacticaseibacillus saniviri]KRO18347.1 peptide deformylase [Lacticaseibacillus saniviri JCM 17471 = DSM 24301]MCG4282976.1 peptide deformylase [Lacticaseibacillus saniviri]
MYLMKDITRDGAPVLRQMAEQVTFPLSEEDEKLANDMMDYLVISQDETENEKYHLRPGVGLAAPQVGVGKSMAAVLVPGAEGEILLKEVFINPKIISHSVQDAALAEGEGCLSVDKDIPGYVVRHDRITVRYQNMQGETKKLRLKNYPAIVAQHEIDHLNGILFYDHINDDAPFKLDPNAVIIE